MLRASLTALVTLLVGCAFTNVPIQLPTDVATGASGGKARQIVLVATFDDRRTITNRCGMQKNGYNSDTADAVCSMDPAAWLASVLAKELQNAGFEVIVEGRAPHKPTAVRLQGMLLKVFVEPTIGFWSLGFETDMHVQLVATSDTGLVAERSFFVKGQTRGQVGRKENFQASFDQATRKLARNLVEGVVELMNRYPQLGHGGHALGTRGPT